MQLFMFHSNSILLIMLSEYVCWHIMMLSMYMHIFLLADCFLFFSQFLLGEVGVWRLVIMCIMLPFFGFGQGSGSAIMSKSS